MKNCAYEDVHCTNPECSELMPRRTLQYHLVSKCRWRVVSCHFCSEMYTFKDSKVKLNLSLNNSWKLDLNFQPSSIHEVYRHFVFLYEWKSLVQINRDRCLFFLSSKQLHMKVCKRIPLECVNKCGAKDIPREEVSDITRARKYLYSPCDVNDRQLIPGKTLKVF